jgi:hypothetical protein
MDILLVQADPRLLSAIQSCTASEWLGDFGSRWYQEGRPETRALLHRFLEQSITTPGPPPHFRAFYKRIFKLAEKTKDHATMARFLVCFDRMKVRHLRAKRAWDSELKRYFQVAKYSGLTGLPASGIPSAAIPGPTLPPLPGATCSEESGASTESLAKTTLITTPKPFVKRLSSTRKTCSIHRKPLSAAGRFYMLSITIARNWRQQEQAGLSRATC